MTLSFEWNDEKAASNLIKHAVAFEDAAHVFFDPHRAERHDGREPYGEDRFVTVGVVGGVELAVTYTMRDDTIRLISARKADRHERNEYWKSR